MKYIFYIILIILIFTALSSKHDTEPECYANWGRYSANIEGKYYGALNFNELSQIMLSNKINPPKPRKGCKLVIKSFTFMYFNPKTSSPVYREIVNNDMFTGTMHSKLMNAKPGDCIIFENIIGECSSSKKLMILPPIIFNYNGIKIRAQ